MVAISSASYNYTLRAFASEPLIEAKTFPAHSIRPCRKRDTVCLRRAKGTYASCTPREGKHYVHFQRLSPPISFACAWCLGICGHWLGLPSFLPTFCNSDSKIPWRMPRFWNDSSLNVAARETGIDPFSLSKRSPFLLSDFSSIHGTTFL